MMNQLVLETVCGIFDDKEQNITVNLIVWISTNKEIWQGKVISITYNYF